MRKEFVYLDQVVEDEFELNRLNADDSDNVEIRNIRDREF
jgi:hypothetical protein